MDHNEEELTNILKTQSPYRNDLHKKVINQLKHI